VGPGIKPSTRKKPEFPRGGAKIIQRERKVIGRKKRAKKESDSKGFIQRFFGNVRLDYAMSSSGFRRFVQINGS